MKNKKLSYPKASKKLGQHYLVDSKVTHKICQDKKSEDEAIIEVGPGPAVLTKYLIQHSLPILVVEKDSRFLPHLSEILPEESIARQDALDLSWIHLLKEKGWLEKKIWVVSNLPYNISVPLFLSFLKCPSFTHLTLMFQKEVGKKIMGGHWPHKTEKDMSSLGVLTENYFKTTLLCEVGPKSFSPPPEVDSVVISFQRKVSPPISLEEFPQLEKFVRALFQFRRKFFAKGLQGFFSKEQIIAASLACELSPQLRAHAMDFDQILKLYLHLSHSNDKNNSKNQDS